jgi:ribosomal protein L37AE/L43A
MAKRTQKVGVVGKYGTRYGASLRKQAKKMEITQRAKYQCNFCGKLVRFYELLLRCVESNKHDSQQKKKKKKKKKKSFFSLCSFFSFCRR